MPNKSTSIPAFPLKWPQGVPRTPASSRKRSQFGQAEWNRGIKGLQRELKLLGATYVTISTNQKLRNDGLPYAQERRMDDSGVAVYFMVDGVQVCFPCDRWQTLAENLRAITLHIESMRGQQRWGVGSVKQAFAGYKALTVSAGEAEDWRTVLGLTDKASIDDIKAAHRAAALAAHPDRGGSADQTARINTARDRAIAEKGAA